MGYAHCDKHDENATNGCLSCHKEKVDVMTDAQVILHVSCYGIGGYREDKALRERMEDIAARLDKLEKEQQ